MLLRRSIHFKAEIKRHLEKGKLSKSRVGWILLVVGGGQFAAFSLWLTTLKIIQPIGVMLY
jgi:hypothetical protein